MGESEVIVATMLENKAAPEEDEERQASQSQLWRDEDDGNSSDITQDIGTACYLCHGQCGNFGVHGREGRPCARGVNEIINRRRRARKNAS